MNIDNNKLEKVNLADLLIKRNRVILENWRYI